MYKESSIKLDKWTNYFLLGIIAFGGFGLELILISIERLILKGSINYILHWILTSVIWGIFAFILIKYSKNSKGFDIFMYKKRPGFKYLLISTLILLGIVVFTNALFWQGFKPALELKNLGFVNFIFQYIYYLFEMVLAVLVIIFGHRAGELLFRSTYVPWGGILLGLTWGFFHTFTQGPMTGIVLFLGSILFGSVYILLQKNVFYTYFFILLMFVL